ncbi:uncharacterized protein At3g28850 [Arachis stenosperma]|uniref:uncharacterized protein At3g28850 n=1 Tax=Arachis stenosperma TaxID=217475 RepID=UPI0025AD67F7|nr:uncharacterized protein At3g28850 [Arachis stenosperma]
MGCVSSKCIREEMKLEEQHHHVTLTNNGGGGYLNHVVSLTSTTYGALKLDNEQQPPTPKKTQCVVTTACSDSKTHRESPSPSPARKEEKPEAIINTWELMEGLEEETQLQLQPLTVKKSPKSTPFLRGFTATTPSDTTKRSPSLKLKRSIGKENKVLQDNNGFTRGGGVRRLDYPSPKSNNVLKTAHSCPNTCKPAFNSGFQPKGSPIHAKRNSVGSETGSAKSLQRKSPLFDPDLVASYERELSEEEEQIKRMIWATPRTRRARKSIDSMKLLQSFEKKCPPGGENVIVIYTTTLRGIRKTFEDCNKVRSIVESYCVHVVERDVSMDSGFKEELRKLMGTKEVKVPVVFVKGRLVGGAEQVVKLEEEEKLGALFEGIPMAVGGGGCEGCGGVRFLMCVACNGSCKVLDSEDPKKTVRCGKCNENGIVQCPLCC